MEFVTWALDKASMIMLLGVITKHHSEPLNLIFTKLSLLIILSVTLVMHGFEVWPNALGGVTVG